MDASDVNTLQSQRKPASPWVWVFSIYFTEGFPYSVIRQVVPVYLRDAGMSLQAVGLTSLYGLPWVLKFLWAPMVDRFGSRRGWMLVSQVVLTALLAVAATLAWGGAAAVVAVLLGVAAIAAATNDTAIDGYYMEALDGGGQARFVGYRVMAYRVALMAGTGVIVTIGALRAWGWGWAFAASAALMALCVGANALVARPCGTVEHGLREAFDGAVKHVGWILGAALATAAMVLAPRLAPDSVRRSVGAAFGVLPVAGWVSLLLLAALVALYVARGRIRRSLERNSDSYYAKAFLSFVDRDDIGIVLAFIVFLRAGEFLLSAMSSSFMVDLGIKVHYGWITGGVGLPCSIAGAMFGGWLIARFGMKRVMWPIQLAQNLTNLIYMALAFSLASVVLMNTANAQPESIGALRLAAVAGVHGFDQFSGGMGTALLMTFLMSLCSSEHKAAHYAIGTGIMSISGVLAGVGSGWLAEQLGYGRFFGLSFLVSIPGMFCAWRISIQPPKFGGQNE